MNSRFFLFVLSAVVCLTTFFSCKSGTVADSANSNYMWFDCEGNYERLSNPDSIRFYLQKCKDAGFDNAVVDVKSIMGEVLYDSKYAPYMGEWAGHYRRQDYDMLAHFIRYGKEVGVKIYASLNIFSGGHNFFDRGIIYKERPQWQSIVYDEGVLRPISEIKSNYNGMLNPSNPEVRKYQLDILAEVANKYKDLDGIIFDRVRYDNVTSDFSELSKRQFEEYAGVKVANYPDDILYWEKDNSGKLQWKEGKHFKKWIEWRAYVIKSFVQEAHQMLKGINPDLKVGDYTGAWYPTYYQVGVNWASKDYDPSADYDWATPEYAKTGYAELLDVYMTGLYYTLVTKEEVDNALGVVGPRTEAGMDNSLTYCYSVEGGAELVKSITKGAAPVIGSLYVEQYKEDFSRFSAAVKQVRKDTDGLMVFDIVHIINHSLWDELTDAMNVSLE